MGCSFPNARSPNPPPPLRLAQAMAPLTRRRKRALAVAPPAIHPADRLSKLPDDVLAHILSFLPAQEAVRTCVLARTWRGLWKLTKRLLITGRSVQEVQKFVPRLLRVRLRGSDGLASLDAGEIRFDPFEGFGDHDDPNEVSLDDADACHLIGWMQRLLKCQIRMLRVDISARTNGNAYLQMCKSDLVSRHLTRLELRGVLFVCCCLDLEGCPALEHLEITECSLADVRKITSLSLKSLVITSCESNYDLHRLQVCVPRLVSLWLEALDDLRTPLLEKMPELVKANVRIGSLQDVCYCDDRMACYHVMRAHHISESHIDSDAEEGSGDYAGENATKCVVLEGLAQAKDLVLMGYLTYVFRRDLRWCPIFSKLKTLVLNEHWCEPADCRALECILEHAPVLEKLTVLFAGEGKLEYGIIVLEGRPGAAAKSTTATQRLKIVEVKCHTIHEGVQNVLKFLSTLNICFNS